MQIKNIHTEQIISLTGDRPTGPLHLGHYVGSLQTRLQLQQKDNLLSFIMVANVQALTDNIDKPMMVHENVYQLIEDYLAIGLNPTKTFFFVQSDIKELYELTTLLLNFVTISRLKRNPTLKHEINIKRFTKSLPCGFFCYPISQAADILLFNTDIVPVGKDQLPMIEQTNEIVQQINHQYGEGTLKKIEARISSTPTLCGINGPEKASKSLNNCIFLNDNEETVKKKVYSMYTDPNHIHVDDPGQIEGNVVFEYLDAFYHDITHLNELKRNYIKGGVGDMHLKHLLNTTLQNFLKPIRERRNNLTSTDLQNAITIGTKQARQQAKKVITKLRTKLYLDYIY